MKSLKNYLQSEAFNLMALFFTILTLASFIFLGFQALWVNKADMLLPFKLSLITIIAAIILKTAFDLLSSIAHRDLLDIFFSILVFILPPVLVVAFIPAIVELFARNAAYINLIDVSFESKLILTAGLILNTSFLVRLSASFIKSLRENWGIITKLGIDLSLYWDGLKSKMKNLKG